MFDKNWPHNCCPMTPGRPIVDEYRWVLEGNEPVLAIVVNAAETGPQGPKGDSGRDGASPRLSANDTWLVYDVATQTWIDTELYAGGQAPYIGANDNWYIGGVDSGVSATGPQGAQGIQGVQGPRGIQGVQGEKGEKGETGPAGPQGEKGEKGDEGPVGPAGPQGEKGETGPAGPAGASGALAYNVLDNSNFENPVNQQGGEEYYTGLSIDRWMIEENDGGYVKVYDGYIHIEGGTGAIKITQYFDKSVSEGQDYYFVCTTAMGGSISFGSHLFVGAEQETVIDDYLTVTVSKHHISLEVDALHVLNMKNIGLYFGNYPSMPQYMPKGYAAELAQCRRYYKQIGPCFIPAQIFEGMLTANLGPAMRDVPQIKTGIDMPFYISASGKMTYMNAFDMTVNQNSGNVIIERYTEADDGIGFLICWNLVLEVEWYGESE